MTQTRREFLVRRFRRAALMCALLCAAGLLLSAHTRAAGDGAPHCVDAAGTVSPAGFPLPMPPVTGLKHATP